MKKPQKESYLDVVKAPIFTQVLPNMDAAKFFVGSPFGGLYSLPKPPASVLKQFDDLKKVGQPSFFTGLSLSLNSVPRLFQQFEPSKADIKSLIGFNWPSDAESRILTDLRPSALVSSFARDWGPIFSRQQRADRLAKAGWLPHTTIPTDLLDGGEDPSSLSSELEHYYRENWETIRPNIEECLSKYEVDLESISCFKEALDNHADGRYRSVCRLLFPEIERVVRARFYPGQLSNITNIQVLRDFAGEMPISEIEYFELFRRLECHIYDKVRTSSSLCKLEQDKVPNRHAAIHGIISYSEFTNSINTIFMTEYVYRIVSMSTKDEFALIAGHSKPKNKALKECFDLEDDADYKRFLKVVHNESESEFWARMRREAKDRPDRFSTPVFQGGPLSPQPPT